MTARPPRPPRRRLPVLLQVGQTLSVLGIAVLVVGLVFHHETFTVAVGAALLVVGVLLLVLGLRARRRTPG